MTINKVILLLTYVRIAHTVLFYRKEGEKLSFNCVLPHARRAKKSTEHCLQFVILYCVQRMICTRMLMIEIGLDLDYVRVFHSDSIVMNILK